MGWWGKTPLPTTNGNEMYKVMDCGWADGFWYLVCGCGLKVNIRSRIKLNKELIASKPWEYWVSNGIKEV